jgi:light-regulated signal transduction histidine kinase (bacteriophytochrome)
MNKLSRREFDTPIPKSTRTDEIGDITRAIHVFRENGRANAELQKEIKRSNQELENFAYVASHDLREPLRMISSFATLLERSLEFDLSQEQKEYIGIVRDGAKRMNQLILDLLEVSRIGRTENTEDNVDLKEVINTALLNISVAISEAEAQVNIPESLPLITCAPREMTRVFQNLIANAIKYSDKSRPPRIDINVARIDEGWQVSVDDNGIGIPPHQFERIFHIFQRLHNKDAYGGGTGIGLAVCKKIVERHGGLIWVEPNPNGVGCRFIFTIAS